MTSSSNPAGMLTLCRPQNPDPELMVGDMRDLLFG